MAAAVTEWPRKTRDIHNHHMDSTFWDGFIARDDDIIISTYSKSGTTWTQQIIAQLLFNGTDSLEVAEISPWVELRFPPKEVKLAALEAQAHRRFYKTHLPVDALVFSPRAKYLYVGRDGRDIVWSLYNHFSNGNELLYHHLNDTPGLVGPPLARPPASIRQYYHDWLDHDGFPFWSFWENVRTWWAIRHLPNVKLIHFANLKRDLPGQIREIAAFLDIPIDESRWEAIVEHCTFDYMKRNASKSTPLGGIFWEGGAQTFINKGTNGRWRDILTAEESQKYEQLAREQLEPACAHWLETGELPE
jgi:aryl sulfotransferase